MTTSGTRSSCARTVATRITRPTHYPISGKMAKIASLWPVLRTLLGTFGHSVNGSALRANIIKIWSALRANTIIKIWSAAAPY